MESERRISWLSLFIRIIIIFVFALIVIWLVSKIISKNKLSEAFTSNINNMEKVSVEYFKGVDLPLEKGQSIKITLGEMIEKKLIVSTNSDGKASCDTKNSYSKITRKSKNYIVETTLKCGDEKDTITKKFSFKDCRNCSQNTTKNDSKNTKDTKNTTNTKDTKNSSTNTTKENTINNDSTKNTTSNGSTSQVKYYEYAKETTTYSNWVRGSKTGDNIENKYEYYGVAKKTYYTLGVIRKEDLTKDYISYTIKLNNVPNNKYYFTTVEEANYFDKSEENSYINQSDNSIYEGISYGKVSTISNYSLSTNNFTYKLMPYYRRGTFYVDVKVYIKNTNNLNSYYDSNTKSNIYFVPLKLNIKFASNEISENKPSGDYETISYYRYVETSRDVIWSTEEAVEGYTKTGNTKLS